MTDRLAVVGERQGPTVNVVTEVEGLVALRSEWESLALSISTTSGALRPAYALMGWDARPPEAAGLHVVTARMGEQLVGVWPLYRRRAYGLTILRPLGNGSCEEYTAPLVDPRAPVDVADAMYAVACGGGDVLEVFNAPKNSVALAALERAPHPRRSHSMVSPVIRLRGVASWQAWIEKKSPSFRKGLAYDHKKLAARGLLRFSEVVRGSDATDFGSWFFGQKRAWLAARGIRSSWLETREAQSFFGKLIGGADSPVRAFRLALNDQTVAGCICIESCDRLEYFATSFDPAYAAYSPGNLLLEDMVKWCIARQLDFDFRITRDPYKLRWSDAELHSVSMMIATTPLGRLALAAQSAKDAVQRLRFQGHRIVRRLRKLADAVRARTS